MTLPALLAGLERMLAERPYMPARDREVLEGAMEKLRELDVAAALSKLGGHTTARALCDELVLAGQSRRDSQLAIQRAIDRGEVVVESDWTLTASNAAASVEPR